MTLGKMWRVLKALNSNRRVCFEWLWSKKKTSAKDKGYGKLITDEEKRCLVMCLNSSILIVIKVQHSLFTISALDGQRIVEEGTQE